jgi:hypothetical protein
MRLPARMNLADILRISRPDPLGLAGGQVSLYPYVGAATL